MFEALWWLIFFLGLASLGEVLFDWWTFERRR